MTHNKLPVENDARIVKKLLRLASQIVKDTLNLNLEWVANKRFVVVPMDSSSHFDNQDSVRISSAIQKVGCKSCYAVATENLGDHMRCFRVSTTASGLMDFNRTCSHFNYLLVPENESFAILCTVDDYFLVAGPREFVTEVCGEIDVARRDFRDCNGNDERLLRMAARYE